MNVCNKTDCIHHKVCREWQSLGNENCINESNGNCDLYQQSPELNKIRAKVEHIAFRPYGGRDMLDRAEVLQILDECEGDLGYWIEERNDYGELTGYHCSACYEDTGFTTDCAWAFCPECGKRMEKTPHEI